MSFGKVRRRYITWAMMGIITGLLLLGCQSLGNAIPDQGGEAQYLDVTAVATLEDGTVIELEVAQTQDQQAKGLMYREPLPDNRGMLFPFEPASLVSFWMKNVPVALDMVFLHQAQVVGLQESVPPCQEQPCPTYGPRALVDQVIELRAGRASELKLEVGDRVQVTSQAAKAEDK